MIHYLKKSGLGGLKPGGTGKLNPETGNEAKGTVVAEPKGPADTPEPTRLGHPGPSPRTHTGLEKKRDGTKYPRLASASGVWAPL